MKKLTLRNKLIIVFLVVTIIPLTVATQVIKVNIINNYANHILKESTAGTEKNKELLNKALTSYVEISEAIIKDEEILKAFYDNSENSKTGLRMYRLLQEYQPNSNVQIHILNVNGKNYSTAQPPNLYNLKVYSDYGIFRQAAKNINSTTIYSNYYTGKGGVKYPLSLIRPILSPPGEIAGYVIMDIPREELLTFFNYFKAPYIKRTILYTDEGFTVLDTGNIKQEGLQMNNSILHHEKNRLTTTTSLKEMNLNLLTEVSTEESGELVANIEKWTYPIIALSAVMAILFSLGFTHMVLRPMRSLLKVIEKAQKGDLSSRFMVTKKYSPEFVTLGRSYNKMLDEIEQLIEHVLEKQHRLNVAEIQALQAQIEPHFYYNFLNDIKSLSKLGRNEDIVRMVMAFGTLLRANMSVEEEWISIREEIKLLQSYLEIHSIRQDHDMNFVIDIDPKMEDDYIPKLLLQPIIENAVIHGMDGINKGEITLKAYAENEDMFFIIEDNGPGISDPEKVLSTQAKGVGLKNVDKRLKLHFGKEYGVKIESTSGAKTKIIVKMKRTLGG